MIWQEIIFSVGAVLFTVALLPSVFSKNKPDVKTSVMTGGILLSFAAAYLSLGMVFSACTTLTTSVTWGVLAVQKLRRINR